MKAEPIAGVISAVLLFLFSNSAGYGQSGETAAGGAVDLKLIEGVYATQKKDAAKPLEQLNEKYRAALEKQRSDFQAAGNLDGVLAAQKGIDEVTKGTVPDGESADPVIGKLENVYLKQLAEVEKAIEEPLEKADRDYLINLEGLALRLTKAGKIEDALMARHAADALKKKQVARETVREMIRPGEPAVKILSASYGTGGKYADVTERVKHYVEVKRETFWANRETLKSDPNPGWNKSVTVKYLKDGVKRERSWGRNEPLRVEDFYGPQDKEELARWLVGTKWKADLQVYFKESKTFNVLSSLTTGTWMVSQPRKVTMVWSEGEVVEGVFDPTWTSFEEQSGKKRTFRKMR